MVIGGMESLTIRVRDMAKSLAFYRDYVGMSLISDELLPDELTGLLWQIPRGVHPRAVTLKHPSQNTLLELVEFGPIPGNSVREYAQPWDYGIYCFTFLLRDIDAAYRDLTNSGYRFIAAPLLYQPNWVPHAVKEATLVGPDGVLIDHFQRMKAEAYPVAGNYVRLDHCALIASDFDPIKRFYGEILGLDLRWQLEIPDGLIDTIIELPPGTKADTMSYHREGQDSLLIEFLKFSEKGKPLNRDAGMPDIGPYMMSFEVGSLEGIPERCAEADFPILAGPVASTTARHGKTRVLFVNGPDQVLVKLFEK